MEIMRFRLEDGVDDAAFLVADRRLQISFCYQQPGLLRRTTARAADGEWVVVELWASPAEADACARRRGSDPAAEAFAALVRRASIDTVRYEELPG
jgi:hypothetical protein